MSRKKENVREQKRGSLSLFLSFLASFAIKEAEREREREREREFGGREIAEESNGDRVVHYGERHKKLESFAGL